MTWLLWSRLRPSAAVLALVGLTLVLAGVASRLLNWQSATVVQMSHIEYRLLSSSAIAAPATKAPALERESIRSTSRSSGPCDGDWEAATLDDDDERIREAGPSGLPDAHATGVLLQDALQTQPVTRTPLPPSKAERVPASTPHRPATRPPIV